jgi:hypothetical protein
MNVPASHLRGVRWHGTPQRAIHRHHAGALARALDRPVTVVVTGNLRRLLRWHVRDGVLELRVARTILGHPALIAAVVASRDADAWAQLQAVHHSGRPDAPEMDGAGAIHDLDGLLVQASERWFDGAHRVPIGWARWPTRPPRRRLQLGSTDGMCVRIHPVLDHRSVPGWLVGFVVFHELLHLEIPPVQRGSRRAVHPRAFRDREALHPDHARAKQWEAEHINALLRRCRRQVQRSAR